MRYLRRTWEKLQVFFSGSDRLVSCGDCGEDLPDWNQFSNHRGLCCICFDNRVVFRQRYGRSLKSRAGGKAA
jgi:hypothetical protein